MTWRRALPFLLLFTRKSDLRAWLALAVASLALCLVTDSPAALPGRAATLSRRIKQLEAPGVVNDYSFEGPRSENMLGFDHAFFGYGALLDRLPARAADVVLRGFDRAARRRPQHADMIIAVWRRR